MRAIELARRAAALGEPDSACQAYELALGDKAGIGPAEQLEAAVYILQFGGNYQISYTFFRNLYNEGYFQDEILPMMTTAFYAPNETLLQGRYERNCRLLEKYPYLFRRDFLPFEDLPIRFFPYDDKSYVPFYRDTMLFGDYFEPGHQAVSRSFFRDLDKPILAADVFSQYELEYLQDNVRKSEYVGRENHVYLHYTSWEEFCSYLQVLNLRPLLKEEKLVFLIGDEVSQYPIDFKERFGVDYSQYDLKPVGLQEINRIIWHTQLSTHNGGDFFNEIFDGHPNLVFLTSVMFEDIENKVAEWRKELGKAKQSNKLRQEFLRKNGGGNSWIIQELCSLQKPTDKDIFIAVFASLTSATRFLDPASRIAPAVFFQPHFHNIEYSLKIDRRNCTVLSSKEYDKTCKSPIFRGFKYVKTFTPMRRFTTSHGATVKFMYDSALRDAEQRRAGKSLRGGKIAVVSDAVSERVLNRSFMIDWQDRLYKDAVVVRLEDGKLNPKATFTALAAFLDLPYTPSMTRCTFDGEPINYHGNLTDGFDPAPIYRTYDDYVNDSERKYIEYFLRDAYEFYGYDFQYYDGQPVTLEQVKGWLDGFTTIDRYIRETWRDVFEKPEIQASKPEAVTDEVRTLIQQKLLEEKVKAFHRDREKNSEFLMRGLRFINRRGQFLHMAPKLELDPALLENPLYR